MPANSNVHPQQFHDWYAGSDAAISHLQAFTAEQNKRTAHIPDWRIKAGFIRDPAEIRDKARDVTGGSYSFT